MTLKQGFIVIEGVLSDPHSTSQTSGIRQSAGVTKTSPILTLKVCNKMD